MGTPTPHPRHTDVPRVLATFAEPDDGFDLPGGVDLPRATSPADHECYSFERPMRTRS